MAEITRQTEPRPSLLWAVYFTGIVFMLAAGKGHLGTWANWLGNILVIGSISLFIARAWYLSRKAKA